MRNRCHECLHRHRVQGKKTPRAAKDINRHSNHRRNDVFVGKKVRRSNENGGNRSADSNSSQGSSHPCCKPIDSNDDSAFDFGDTLHAAAASQNLSGLRHFTFSSDMLGILQPLLQNTVLPNKPRSTSKPSTPQK